MRFVLFPIMAVAFVFLVGFLVMTLWNHTLPALFGISTLTFWQAVMLFLLCKILFGFGGGPRNGGPPRSEEHTSELQSLMRISYAVFCLKKKNIQTKSLL